MHKFVQVDLCTILCKSVLELCHDLRTFFVRTKRSSCVAMRAKMCIMMGTKKCVVTRSTICGVNSLCRAPGGVVRAEVS